MWNGLSDYGVEELVNDSLSASAFCNLALEDDVPDHSILSRFRSYMTKCSAFDQLLLNINTQLEAKSLMVKTVTKVDASITDSPRKTKGQATFEVDDNNHPQRYYPPSVDKDASWVKKAGRIRYGFKKHIITDDEGFVIDSKVFEDLVSDANLAKGREVQADKAYKSKDYDDDCLKNWLMAHNTKPIEISH